MEDKPQQNGEGQPKRGTRRKKASEEALLETSSGSEKETSSKAKRGTRKNKASEVTNSEVSSNGARVTGSKTTRKKTAIAISDENTQDAVLQDTISHETTNGHVSAKTAKAMTKKR